MKRIPAILLAASAAALALAEAEFLQLPADGSPVAVAAGGRVVALQGFDAFTAQRVDELWTNAMTVAETPATNWTYSLVYSNATSVVTNTVDRDMAPLPAGLDYISYTTNRTVTTTAVTNWAPVRAACATNALGGASLSGGVSRTESITNGWVSPGTLLRRSAAGLPGARAVIER